MLAVGAKDMVAVLDLIDDRGQFAFGLAAQPHAEDLADLVGGQSPESEFAGTLEDFVDGEVPLEDEVAAVFDLGDGVESRQIHLLPLLGGKLWPQQEGPVVEPLANDLRTEPVGGGLEFGGIIDGQEGIIVLAETDLGAPQFLFDEGMAVEIVGGLERKKRGDPHDDGAEDLIADVKIVVREATPLMRQDAMVRVLGGILGHADAEGGPLFHAFEDEVDAVG